MGIPVFDAHCDTIYRVAETGGSLRRNCYHTDLERGMAFSPYAQVFAVFTRPWGSEEEMKSPDYSRDWPPEVLADQGKKLLARLLEELEDCGDIALLCRCADDARAAGEAGKAAAFIAIEGAELLGCSLAGLKVAYDRGVRLINLCWNYDNALCGAACGPTGNGLTELGARYVAGMQELGIVVDLSHVSERTFWDVAGISQKPIIAGHSNAKAICGSPRNLTDEQFRELARNKGGAGLNLCGEFLENHCRADVDSVIRHAEHFLGLGGEKALFLGGDLDGIEKPPGTMTGIESYNQIYEAMLRRNYTESLVRDIFYNNLLNILERAL